MRIVLALQSTVVIYMIQLYVLIAVLWCAMVGYGAYVVFCIVVLHVVLLCYMLYRGVRYRIVMSDVRLRDCLVCDTWCLIQDVRSTATRKAPNP